MIGNRNSIAFWRSIKKISQRELAKELGLNRSIMSHIETGKVAPTLEQIERISEILKKPATVIFDLE